MHFLHLSVLSKKRKTRSNFDITLCNGIFHSLPPPPPYVETQPILEQIQQLQQAQNSNNNVKSNNWTWHENKVFEKNLLKYLEGILEGRWENLASLISRRSSTEGKEHYESLLYDLAFNVKGRTTYLDDHCTTTWK